MSDEHKEYDGISYKADDRMPAVFKLLLAGLLVWGVCFMGYYLFSGWSSEAEFAAKKAAQEQAIAANAAASAPQTGGAGAHKEGALADYIAAGKKEYAARCAACHGADAKGGIGPDLTAKQYKYGRSEQAVTESVANGRPGGMPGFRNDLSHEKLEGVVKYLLSL
ncbi:c-type cytochrome [Trichlorobacter ammonificans]|uniref:Cytochrome c oxidase subunit CcoP n=1 Tax=Trichlorobacter ammonificans TaxID=2916410 RepID=A0ABN8HP37_9BACT|nr:c-type cytochrome [Trichlorobacter ammonificans]CAH2031747.1 Cytochrome c oxidase subunit CcoP [Trichlorobacter ammonificans]